DVQSGELRHAGWRQGNRRGTLELERAVCTRQRRVEDRPQPLVADEAGAEAAGPALRPQGAKIRKSGYSRRAIERREPLFSPGQVETLRKVTQLPRVPHSPNRHGWIHS